MFWPIPLPGVLLFPAALEGLVEARSIDLEIQAPVGLWAFHASHFHPHCGDSPAHTRQTCRSWTR